MDVRKATITDLPDMLRMGAEFHASHEWPSAMEYRRDKFALWLSRNLSNPSLAFFVDENVESMCAIAVHENYFSGEIVAGELFWWVDECARKSKVSRKLWDAMHQWAESMGAKAISMAALNKEDLPRIEKMYARAGYKLSELAYVKDI